jgi:hypothetical protein
MPQILPTQLNPGQRDFGPCKRFEQASPGGPIRSSLGLPLVQTGQLLPSFSQASPHLSFNQRQQPKGQQKQMGLSDNLIIPTHIQWADSKRTIFDRVEIPLVEDTLLMDLIH